MGHKNLLQPLRLAAPCLALISLLAMICLLALIGLGAGEERLSISRTSDGEATIVTITGPKILLDRVAEIAALRKSCDGSEAFEAPGFSIHWGDDDAWVTYVSPLPAAGECPDPLKHVYAVPGTYKIGAEIGHLGLLDGHVTDWHDNTSVLIDGTLPPLALSVIAPPGDKSFFFREPVTVRWKLSTPTPVDLLVEIIDQDGIVLGKRSFQGLKYASEGEAWIGYDDDAYATHLRNEATPVIARVHVQEQGRDLLISDSEPFRVTAQRDYTVPGFVGMQAELVADVARTVRVRHHPDTVSCHSYGIDWGDGSPLESRDIGCGRHTMAIETLHTYRRSGNYRIVLRTDEHGQADSSLANAPYRILQVTVP